MNFSRFTIIRDDDKIQDKVGGEGQKNTKYLLNLEKRNIESNSLLNVVDKKNGNTLSKQVDIWTKFIYCFPFSTHYSKPEEFIKRLPNITCEGEWLSLEECSIVLGSLCIIKDKAPGSDGISLNVYKFWPSIGELDLYYSYNIGSFQRNNLEEW